MWMVVMEEGMATTEAMTVITAEGLIFFSLAMIMAGGVTFKIIAIEEQRVAVLGAQVVAALGDTQRVPMREAVDAAAAEVMVEVEDDIEPHNLWCPCSHDSLMKFLNQLTHFSHCYAIFLLAFACTAFPARIHAAASDNAPQFFPSSEAAITALKTAVAANDRAALLKLFGPEFNELMTGDKVQDANNLKQFAADLAQRCHPVKDGEGKITLEVGANDWPMPIPLVRVDGQWHFDTLAGKEEIINRHIGKDELTAIAVCRAYVGAQRQYASMNPEEAPGTTYAQHLKSAPGKKDGLYWEAVDHQPASPFGPLVAQAQAEGYVVHARGSGSHPFHGYYFRILTQQGAAAPGGTMSYLSEGALTKGFALVAYPEHWDQSGVMTFIVNQDGKVFQRNLGAKTSDLAQEMKGYNPDSNWTLVQDKGISDAVSGK